VSRERAFELPDSRANKWAIQITEEPPRNSAAALLQGDPSPRMTHESKGRPRPILSNITPELDSTYMLGVLVPVVSRCHQAERGSVVDRQRLTVQTVRQQDGLGQQVRERQARGVAVLTSKNHEQDVALRTSSGDDDSFVEVREPKAAPSERTPGPRRDAVEVGCLVDAGQIAKLV
jgi:hypothetical protein